MIGNGTFREEKDVQRKGAPARLNERHGLLHRLDGGRRERMGSESLEAASSRPGGPCQLLLVVVPV